MKKETLEKICNTFLLLGPILDILTAFMLNKGILSVTVGVVVRFCFLAFIILYLLFLKEGKEEKKKTYLFLVIFSLYFLCFLLLAWKRGSHTFLFEGKQLMRSFYFPLLLYALYKVVKKEKIVLSISWFSKLYYVYLFFLFVPTLLGVGFDSYAVTKKGSVGFFYSANEISAILSILMPFFFLFLYEKKKFLLTTASFFILFYVLLSIGTKGPLLSFFLLIFFLGLHFLIQWVKNKKWKYVFSSFVILCLALTSFCFLFPKTNFYKNVEVHLHFLKVDSILDVFQDPHLIDHFVFSSRLSFWKKSQDLFGKAPLSEKLFGLGYITEGDAVKMVEMDPVDLFYRHGIIGFLLYFGVFLSFLIPVVKWLRKQRKGKVQFAFQTSLFLMVLLSFFTGHILLAPAVSIYVIYLLIHLRLGKEDFDEVSICYPKL